MKDELYHWATPWQDLASISVLQMASSWFQGRVTVILPGVTCCTHRCANMDPGRAKTANALAPGYAMSEARQEGEFPSCAPVSSLASERRW